MSMNSELAEMLELKLPDKKYKKRDITLTFHHYGFKGIVWPTFEATGEYVNLKTRQRVEQINKDNLKVFSSKTLTSLQKIRKIINRKKFWVLSELESELIENECIVCPFNVVDLLRFASDIGKDLEYVVYTPLLEHITRYNINEYSEYIVLHNSIADDIINMYTRMSNYPGIQGIAKLKDFLAMCPKAHGYIDVVIGIMKVDDHIWTTEIGNDTWYLFENRCNKLFNILRKVFTAYDYCNVNILSEACLNTLEDGKDKKLTYPSASIISEYIKSSMYLGNAGDRISYIGDTDIHLNRIEADTVNYLIKVGSTKYTLIRDYLSEIGYHGPYIDKVVRRSPFVHVDRSLGLP